MVFISVVISLYDKTGFLLKFYLFRIAALGCFLMYLYVFLLLKRIPKMPALIKTGFFLIGFYMIVAAGMNTVKQIFHYDPKPDFQELVNYVKQNTNPKEIILNLGDYDLSFPRKTRRDEFVIFKFVPGGGPKIYEWYMRILARKNVADDLSQINNLKEKYKLNYLLCDHILDPQNCLKLLFRNKSYYFYKIL
jgi:hypothetical protein